MTIEDIKRICQIYDNLRAERDAATIAYNSEDAFWGHVLATYNLSQPSFSSNLDKAAGIYAIEVVPDRFVPDEGNGYKAAYTLPDIKVAFKAGAEWMVEQGYTKEGIAHPNIYEIWVDFTDTDIRDGDEVIVQIHKK